MAQKIIIAGGTGFLGTAVIRFLQKQEDKELVVLTRSPSYIKENVSYIQWDGKTPGNWIDELENSTAVINLAGQSVNCRYTKKNKAELIASRVDPTLALAWAIVQLQSPPAVWINAGSAAIYGNSGDIIKDEQASTGDGFPAVICKEWETAFFSADTVRTRKVMLRMGLVFQPGTGLLQPFANLAMWGLGGTIGSGEQYISWIHETDFLNVLQTVLTNETYSGIVNCSSPNPVTNRHFMKALRETMKQKIGIPTPSLLVKAGAVLIGTEAELVLNGRRVVSKILEERKFQFQQPTIEQALQHLLVAQ